MNGEWLQSARIRDLTEDVPTQCQRFLLVVVDSLQFGPKFVSRSVPVHVNLISLSLDHLKPECVILLPLCCYLPLLCSYCEYSHIIAYSTQLFCQKFAVFIKLTKIIANS